MGSGDTKSPIMFFFEQPVFEGEVSHDLFQRLRLAAEILHLVRGRGARCVAREPPFAASRNPFDQP